MSLLFVTYIQVTAEENQYSTVDKNEYYLLLGVDKNTSLVELEYVYHKKVDKLHAIIKSAQIVSKFHSQHQKESEVVNIYGHISEGSMTFWSNKNFCFAICYQDQQGDKLFKQQYLTVDNQIRDEVYLAQQMIFKLRKAYETISGTTIEKIKLREKEVNTQGLNQEGLYFLCENEKFEDAVRIIQIEQNNKNILVEENILEKYFVFGEKNQDESLLSIEDQQKAKLALEQRFEREKPLLELYASKAQNGEVIAAIGLIGLIISFLIENGSL